MPVKRLKDLHIEDRPRERLQKVGAEQLKNEELLQILIGSGVRGHDVRAIAKKIVLLLEKEKEITPDMLRGIKGLGAAKIPVILSAIELGRRQSHDSAGDVSLLRPIDVWGSLPDIRRATKEHFVILYLNSRDREIQREVISIGTVNMSVVHPREVFESAVKYRAASIIGVHNHPTRSLEPSDADVSVTQRLVEAGRILGIEFYDHIIITEPGIGEEDDCKKFFSFREHYTDLFD